MLSITVIDWATYFPEGIIKTTSGLHKWIAQDKFAGQRNPKMVCGWGFRY